MTDLLDHVRYGDMNECTDPDCELHHPEVGVAENTVTETQVAFFLAGADRMASMLEIALNDYGDSVDAALERVRDDIRRGLSI